MALSVKPVNNLRICRYMSVYVVVFTYVSHLFSVIWVFSMGRGNKFRLFKSVRDAIFVTVAKTAKLKTHQ